MAWVKPVDFHWQPGTYRLNYEKRLIVKNNGVVILTGPYPITWGKDDHLVDYLSWHSILIWDQPEEKLPEPPCKPFFPEIST